MSHETIPEIQALFEAAISVESVYFQPPRAGTAETRHRERVYCYELYHQWRSRWPKRSLYSLGGEVDKSGHPLIRSAPKPDMLVHVPGRMDNLLVMEVKAAAPRMSELMKDMTNLTYFRRELAKGENYRCAFLWLYGVSERSWPRLRDRIVSEVGRSENEGRVRLDLVVPVIHPAAREPAKMESW